LSLGKRFRKVAKTSPLKRLPNAPQPIRPPGVIARQEKGRKVLTARTFRPFFVPRRNLLPKSQGVKTMPRLRDKPAAPVASSALHAIELPEPLQVRVALADRGADVAALVKHLPGVTIGGRTLVLGLWPTDSPTHLGAMLDVALAKAQRVFLTCGHGASAAEVQRQSELVHRTLEDWRLPIAYEADPYRAVVGAMLLLSPDDRLDVVWPSGSGLQSIKSLLVQGGRWRAAWRQPEEGEFHPI
jgi:hypothetical protein